jgi:DNA invertase Pin-like site-specific DNA recombinase
MRAAGRIVDRHATFERATIGERTTSILAQTRSKGRMKGGSRKHPEYVTSAKSRERTDRAQRLRRLEMLLRLPYADAFAHGR